MFSHLMAMATGFWLPWSPVSVNPLLVFWSIYASLDLTSHHAPVLLALIKEQKVMLWFFVLDGLSGLLL